ncbi:MAG: LysR family transcriptional regulator [Thermomonas sp.]|uniref:LysR family transcriptional regulator n=1 Tax=Thermomonas sp. TaxID=1971895 RepID=UPI00260DD437|nr:LysR family transcriptional regulator [Thermomonas sp.]MCC7095780.1 LysR family transcriptional regulator [Thermomonas sp.]
MELANLAAFIAVADCGGFSAAAHHIHLTQPAISKRIAQLEDGLQARLFDRIGRQSSLTEAGRILLPKARALLADADAARHALQDLKAEVGGSLRLACSHHIGLHRLPTVLRRYTATYPNVALELRFMESEQALDEVLQARVDLALTTLGTTRWTLPAPLRATPVWEDSLCCVAGADHPLIRRKRLKPAQLAAHPAVLPEPQTFTHRIIADAFARHGLSLQLRMTTNYLETLKMLASTGLAWSVLPRSMLDHGLQVLPVSGLRLHRQLGCVTHAGRTLSRAAQALQVLLREGAG